jgi:hypothetical protein
VLGGDAPGSVVVLGGVGRDGDGVVLLEPLAYCILVRKRMTVIVVRRYCCPAFVCSTKSSGVHH